MKTLLAPPEAAGKRLDLWLAEALPELSRSRLQALVRSGHIRANGRETRPSHKVKPGMRLDIEIPPPADTALRPEPIPLNVLHEDADIIVLDKPAGLVVHPAAGHASGTLVNALLAHCPDLAGIGGEKRPGIVHRLDRDTSGVMVAAKNEPAMRALMTQFRRRAILKEYMALVAGVPQPPKGRIETLIGRHPRDRKKMSATPARGRPAVTSYETIESFPDAALLRVRIETGRTHQIRVHMAHLGFPVLGDVPYGRRRAIPGPAGAAARQMLHAERLELAHPRTGERLAFVAPLPDDMRNLIETLRQGASRRSGDRRVCNGAIDPPGTLRL
jgi:23S rRNA pseudouridine1911/1915/1917 synthase